LIAGSPVSPVSAVCTTFFSLTAGHLCARGFRRITIHHFQLQAIRIIDFDRVRTRGNYQGSLFWLGRPANIARRGASRRYYRSRSRWHSAMSESGSILIDFDILIRVYG